ncbi:MAG: hypothetical protein GY805_10745 [Chloroflexi bacterium]|nr:hypothetical protein [Chloroflexota bacterium]
MFWLNKQKRIWRIIILTLLLIAFIGPWTFDRIHVPAQYACSAPFIRLEGDFCGMPLSGMWFLTAVIGQIFSIVVMIVTGATDHNLARGFLISLFFILLLLPVFSTLFLILSKRKPRRQIRHVAVWTLATVSGLWFLLSSLTQGGSPIQLWGLWGYIVLATTALTVEIAVLVGKKRPFSLKQ